MKNYYITKLKEKIFANKLFLVIAVCLSIFFIFRFGHAFGEFIYWIVR